jgi:hypothetical protein
MTLPPLLVTTTEDEDIMTVMTEEPTSAHVFTPSRDDEMLKLKLK